MLKKINFFTANNLTALKITYNFSFLTVAAKLVLILLKQAFIKASIFHHFDLERYICIETNAFGYAIDDIFS